MSEKILIVVDSINVDDSSGSKANVALIQNLKSIGYEVTVLHYTRMDIHLNGVRCIAIKEKKYNIYYLLGGIQRVIQRNFNVNLAKHIEPVFGFSFTFFNDVKSIKNAIKKVNNLDFALIITRTKGGSFRPHYAVNKLPYLHDKWMAYIHDPYPMSCYPKPYQWNEPGYKKKKRFINEVSIHAKYSAFPSLLLKKWMGTFFSNFNKTGIIIPHQNYKLKEKERGDISLYDSTEFTVLHAGNLLKQRNPEGLIKGFLLFLNNNPQAKKESKLILLGKASYHEDAIKQYAFQSSQLYIKLENVPFEQVYWLQQQVDVNVILEAQSDVSPFLPGKFPHCVAANKPILHLGPQNSETKRLLGGNYAFWAIIDDEVAIAEKLSTLYKKWLFHNKDLVLDRPDLESYLGVSFLKEQIDKILKDV